MTLKVNGKNHTVDADPTTPLLYILRNDLNLQGPRFGCGLGQCGACTVIINGVATRSCILPAGSVKAEITTLEGLAKNGKLHLTNNSIPGSSSTPIPPPLSTSAKPTAARAPAPPTAR